MAPGIEPATWLAQAVRQRLRTVELASQTWSLATRNFKLLSPHPLRRSIAPLSL